MRILLLAVASLVSAAEATSAQTAPSAARRGFVAALGLGAGSSVLSCDGCPDDNRKTGYGGRFLLGAAVNPHLIVGAELEGWGSGVSLASSFSGQATRNVSLGWLSLVGQWYPKAEDGFFAKMGVGGSTFTIEDFALSGSVVTQEAYGLGLLAGAGYDARVSTHVLVTPYVTLLWSGDATAKIDGKRTGVRYRGNVVDVGVALTWSPIRP